MRQHKAGLTFNLFLSLLFVTASSIYETVPWLYLHGVPLSVIPSITVTWRYSLPAVFGYSMSLERINILPNSLASFSAEFVTVSTTSCVIDVSNYGSATMFAVPIRILVVTQSLPFVELGSSQYFYHLPGSSETSKTLYFNSVKFIFDSPKIVVRVYLYWIKCYSTVPTRSKVAFTGKGLPSSNIVEISLSALAPNVVEAVKFTVLIFKRQPNYSFFTSLSITGSMVPLSFQQDFGVPFERFGLSFFDNRCTINIVTFDFNIDSATGVSTAYQIFFVIFGITQQPNINQYSFLVDCWATCPRATFVNAQPDLCELCSDYMQYCGRCEVKNVCQACYLGEIVVGGCTKQVGCLEVGQQLASNQRVSYCVKCNSSEFTFVPLTKKCECTYGWLAGHHCTNVTGCTATEQFAGEIICIACSIPEKFALNKSSHTCYCIDGYFLNDTKCQEICGDGVVFDAQCDDGNLVDGDGCSSSCQLEVNHRCYTNSGPSNCQYIGFGLKVRLTNTVRMGSQNQGKFTFVFQPQMPLFQKFNIQNYFKFSCPTATVDSVSWSLEGEQVIATVDFATDIQSEQAQVIFDFDRSYVNRTPLSLNFEIKSKGAELRVSKESQRVQIFEKIFLSLSFAALVLLIVGSWAHKMVGVQLVHAYQLLYYLHFTQQPYTLAAGSIKSLSLLSMNDLFWQQSKQNTVMFGTYQRIAFAPEYLEFSFLTITLFGLFCFVCFIVYWIINRWISASPDKTNRFAVQFYQCFMFPIAFAFLLPCIILQATLSTQRTQYGQPLLSIYSLLVAFFESALLTAQFFSGISSSSKAYKFGLVRQSYIAVYCIYSFILFIFLVFKLKFGKEYCEYALIATVLLMLIWLIVRRPYFSCLDNIGVIFDLGLVLVFSCYSILRNKGVLAYSEDNDIIACLLLICLCSACAGLSLARVLRALWNYNFKTAFQAKSQVKGTDNTMQMRLEVENEELLIRNRINRKMAENSSYFKQALLRPLGQIIENQNQDQKDDAELAELVSLHRQKFRATKKSGASKLLLRQTLGNAEG